MALPAGRDGTATLLERFFAHRDPRGRERLVQRRSGEWRILSLDPIYEYATLTPSAPGETIDIPADDLAEYRSSYAILAWQFAQLGQSVNEDLLGDDRPEPVAEFYATVWDWFDQAEL